MGAVPHTVVGPALIRPVVFQGPNGQQALDSHLVEGLLAQDLGVWVLEDQQRLGLVASGKSRVQFRVSGCSPLFQVKKVRGVHLPISMAPAQQPRHVGLGVPRGVTEYGIRAIDRVPRDPHLRGV